MPWIKCRYYSQKIHKTVGHNVHIQNKKHFKLWLEVWGIDPRDIESLEIDGQPFDPNKLIKRGGSL